MVQQENPLGPTEPEVPVDPEETFTIELCVHPEADELALFQFIIENLHEIALSVKQDTEDHGNPLVEHLAYAIKTARLVSSTGEDWHVPEKDYKDLE